MILNHGCSNIRKRSAKTGAQLCAKSRAAAISVT